MDKLYIAVLDEFPDYMVPTLVAHSVLAAHLKFQNNIAYKTWLEHDFRKVVVRVNQKEFDKICQLNNVHVGHEKHTLNGKDSCAITFVNQEETPNVLRFAKLWKPNEPN